MNLKKKNNDIVLEEVWCENGAGSPTEGSYKATFSNMQITECKWESDADWRD